MKTQFVNSLFPIRKQLLVILANKYNITSHKETIMKTSNKNRLNAAPYLWGPGTSTVEPPSAHTVVENPWVLLLSTGFALWVLSGIIA